MTQQQKQAMRIAKLAVERHEAELAILRVEGNWQPGHLDEILAAYRARTRAQLELDQAIKEFRGDA